MIPINITSFHITSAIREINRSGVPTHRKSKGHDLLDGGQRYPPKYVISVANKYPNNVELDYRKFNGGRQETNPFLESRGFTIVPKL